MGQYNPHAQGINPFTNQPYGHPHQPHGNRDMLDEFGMDERGLGGGGGLRHRGHGRNRESLKHRKRHPNKRNRHRRRGKGLAKKMSHLKKKIVAGKGTAKDKKLYNSLKKKLNNGQKKKEKM